jgi:hypothetical protein
MQATQKPFSREEMALLIFNRTNTTTAGKKSYALAIDLPLRPTEIDSEFNRFVGGNMLSFGHVWASVNSNNTGVQFLSLTSNGSSFRSITPRRTENKYTPGSIQKTSDVENASSLVGAAVHFANQLPDVDTDALRRILRGTL